MRILGARDLEQEVIDRGLCTVCGACVGVCPYHLDYRGKVATLFECDLDRGQCYAVCPHTDVDRVELARVLFDAEPVDSPLGRCRTMRAARAGDLFSGHRFQNGGTVSALMVFALEEGMIEAAVLTGQVGNLPEPKLVTDRRGVIDCATTRYMATPTLSAVNRAVHDGRRRLGVVGTGCQTQALAVIRSNPLGKTEFKEAIGLSLGLFCTWSLDTRRFLAYLENHLTGEKILGMDVPPPPAETMVVETASGRIEFPLAEIRDLIPPGCAFCGDMTAEWADVSVGALEGRPGWNTLLVRSKNGERWVASAAAAGYLELAELPRENLEQLIRGAQNKRIRAETRWKEEMS